ncbi:hypothetical protein B0T16DRAFT_407865 [Cercophora newfieldiana]|uniref:Transmembrane protein n=1 Tax=Cercophora newfieldiana TaxID=92897 RepID=A0AA39YBW6_9PEZI|nr:hypothetical protein B0T16DRAFT_407865 [Cercophora newfieldiana]
MDDVKTNMNMSCPTDLGVRVFLELVYSDPKFNITEFVIACPQTCKALLGLGNPDISGIGVNIAYCIQIGASILFGPIAYLVLRCWPTRLDEMLWPLYQEVLDTLVKQNAAFTFPVGTAACIAFSWHSPTEFEVSFLLVIVLVQALCLLVVIVLCILVTTELEDSRGRTQGISWVWLLRLVFRDHNCVFCRFVGPVLIATNVCFLLPFAADSIVYTGRASEGVREELVLACNVLKELYGEVTKAREREDTIKFGLIWVSEAVYLAAIPLILAAERSSRFLLRIPKPLAEICSVMITVYFSAVVVWYFTNSQKLRQQAMAMMDGESTDNDWGFGQIVAVFLWVPLLLKLLECAIRIRRPEAAWEGERTPEDDFNLHPIPR